jgi:crossover junction endodeoxyribonuclease RusA
LPEPYEVKFAVQGIEPAPQGSKTHVGNGIMRESCARVKPWRYAVSQAALETGEPMITTPVFVQITFIFNRLVSHYNTKGELKKDAPFYKPTRPDLDKLCRSTLDGITGVLIKDDSQVVNLICNKVYANEGELPGALITINPL